MKGSGLYFTHNVILRQTQRSGSGTILCGQKTPMAGWMRVTSQRHVLCDSALYWSQILN
jgi:hypothetical protein